MSELERSTPPQEDIKRRAILVSQNIGINNILFAILGVYLIITTKNWQGYGILLLAAEAVVGGFISASLIRQGKPKLGAQILLLTNCLAPALGAWVIADFSLVSMAYIVVSTYFIYNYATPKESRRTALFVIATALLVSIASDVIDPVWRVKSSLMLTLGPIFIGILGIILLVIVARQAWRNSVRNKLLILLAGITILLTGTISAINISNVQEETSEDERLALNQLLTDYADDVELLESSAAMLSISLAENEEIKSLYLADDRDGLLTLLTPLFETLKNNYAIRHLYVIDTEGVVYVRIHNPEKYGDDITYRRTAAAALEGRRTISGVEIGPNRLGIRSVSPLLDDQNKFIGMVEVGIDYDQAFIDDFKAHTGADYTMWVTHEAAAPAKLSENFLSAFVSPYSEIFSYASTATQPYPIPKEVYEEVLESGEPNLQFTSIGDEEFAVLVAPMIGYGGRTIGIVEIGNSHSATLAEIQSDTRATIFTTIGLLILSLGIFWAAIHFLISRPLVHLTNTAQRQTEGDLNARAEIKTEDEFNELGSTLNSMTSQLQNFIGTLEDRVAERTKAQETVAEIATAVATIPDLQEMLERTVHLTQRGFGLYHAHVFTYQQDSEELQIVACGYQEGDEHEGTHGTTSIPIAQEQSLVARAARNRAPVIVNDVRNEPGWLPNALLPDTRAELAVPLIAGDRLLGVLDVQAAHLDAFTDADANIQTTLASQIAVSMQNLLQFEETQKVASDLSVVAEVGIATSTITERDPLLQEVVDLSKKSFDLYHAHIYLLNEAGDSLELASGAGDVGRQMVSEGLSIPLAREQSLVAQAARTREGVIVNDVRKDPNFLPNPLLPNTRSEMAVPMVVAGKLVGVLDVQSDQTGRFGAIDANINTTLASQIAIALENTTSFERIRKQAEYETTLNLITQKIQGTDTIEEAMQIAARELGQALGRRQTMVALDPDMLKSDREGVSNE
ncbi:MAG: GAF domain-containing protein [Chloroflexi bacterium]|nr:GAF domain-containing protein [Chloroflexota bacterium]